MTESLTRFLVGSSFVALTCCTIACSSAPDSAEKGSALPRQAVNTGKVKTQSDGAGLTVCTVPNGASYTSWKSTSPTYCMSPYAENDCSNSCATFEVPSFSSVGYECACICTCQLPFGGCIDNSDCASGCCDNGTCSDVVGACYS